MTLLSKVCSNWVWFRLRWFRQLHKIYPGDFACCKPPAKCLWTADGIRLHEPRFVTDSGQIYVADGKACQIVVFNPGDTRPVKVVGTHEPPVDLLVQNECLYVLLISGRVYEYAFPPALEFEWLWFVAPGEICCGKSCEFSQEPHLVHAYLTHVACSRFVSWYDSYWKWWKCNKTLTLTNTSSSKQTRFRPLWHNYKIIGETFVDSRAHRARPHCWEPCLAQIMGACFALPGPGAAICSSEHGQIGPILGTSLAWPRKPFGVNDRSENIWLSANKAGYGWFFTRATERILLCGCLSSKSKAAGHRWSGAPEWSIETFQHTSSKAFETHHDIHKPFFFCSDASSSIL